MAITAFTATKNWSDGTTWTTAKLDAFVDALDTWLSDEVETKCADKTGTETISGAHTFSGTASFTGDFILKRAAVGAGNYTMLAGDHIIGKTAITGGGDTVALISAATVGAGRIVIVKDESGNATATDSIDINPNGSETVDGTAVWRITQAYGSVILYSNGTNWFDITTQKA